MGGYLHVRAERRNGASLMRIAGDLDSVAADSFAARADAALESATGPVVIDLSGLTFVDAAGARALASMISSRPADQLTAVRSCPPHVRRVLDLLGLPPLSYWRASTPGSAADTSELVSRLRRAMLDASRAKYTASDVVAQLADTCSRVASTRERTYMMVAQGRRTVVTSRAARERLTRSRQGATA